MRILKIMAIILCSVASAMGQATLQQPPGTYTNNSVIIRDGAANKVKNAPNLTLTTSATPGEFAVLSLKSTAGGVSGLISGLEGGGDTSLTIRQTNGSSTLQNEVNLFFDGNFSDTFRLNYFSPSDSQDYNAFTIDTNAKVLAFNNGFSTPTFTSTATTGTAPFVVGSTTLVANLHAATADSSTTTTTATNATNTAITDDTSTSATMYPTWVTAATGNLPQKVSSTKWTFNPSTGINTATGFTGALNGSLGATTPSTVVGTTGVFGSTTSLLVGTAGSAVGNIGFRNATSGTATLAPPTGALGTYSVTLPNAASTLPIFGQQVTFSGPTAARAVTLLDLNYTTARQDAAQTFTGVQTMTSPAIVTSLDTASTSFTALAGATTLLTIGGTGASASMFAPSTLDATSSTTGAIRTSGGISAAKAANIGTTLTVGTSVTIGSGASTAGAVVLGQGATQSTGTTNITIQAPTSVTSYLLTLPGAVGAAGSVLTDAAGNGVLSWAAASGSLTATQVGYGSAGNALTGEAAFTYTAASNTLGVDAIQLGATGVAITQDSDGAITLTGSSAGADEDMTINLDDTANTIVVSSSTGVTTINTGAIGLVTTGANSIGPLVDSVDGTTPLNNINQVVAAGTAYTMTTSYATVDFGTTDPVLTIANAGTYSLYVDIQTTLVSATTTTQTESFKLRRTNNTAADITASTFGTPLPVATVGSQLGPMIHIGPIKYSTVNVDDSITVQGILSASLGAGTVTVTACNITAIRAY